MKRILVVDDEPVVRALVAASLAGECEVDAAVDGRAALESVEEVRPDLILLDVGLPGMSGAEVLRRLRAGEQTSSIPVLMLTGLEPPEELRPDGVLLKPFTPASLKASISSWLA
jgi:two-component system KDP operon response regulator KdpE